MSVESREDRGLSLEERAGWVRRETLKIHGRAPETRIASSLSCVEIFVALYYGNILRFRPDDPSWEGRDRLIVSKGHGAVSLYPILADLGFFDPGELVRVGSQGSFIGGIPDPVVPGFESINGSLGHGLGVGCGMALALKNRGRREKVVVLAGDGELYEGAVWEAVMFAAEHRLDNLMLIVDNNKVCMLDYCRNVLDIEPLTEKFRAFRWDAGDVDGHDAAEVRSGLSAFMDTSNRGRPCVLVADTVKGKGVPELEGDRLSHVRSLDAGRIEELVAGLS